jgi:chorismate synthase
LAGDAVLVADAVHHGSKGRLDRVGLRAPAGWGEPVFEKLEADLAAACMSLPATKERGSAS